MEITIKPLTTLWEESNDYSKEDNSKQYMKKNTPLTDISDFNRNKKELFRKGQISD